MNEQTLKNLFEKYLVANKIDYKREFRAHALIMDFNINIDGKSYGVEVKSSKGNVFTTLGQLTLAKRTFSHIYLLAPKEFISRIQDAVADSGVGTIIFDSGAFSFATHPKAPKYFFNKPSPIEEAGLEKPNISSMVMGDKDFKILAKFESKAFTYLDVMKFLNTTRSDAYARINRLMKVGLVAVESSFNPKSYKVMKVADRGVKIKLQ
jgi:hypothetical protein